VCSKLLHQGCARIVSYSVVLLMSVVVSRGKGYPELHAGNLLRGAVVMLCKKELLSHNSFVYASRLIVWMALVRTNTPIHNSRSMGVPH